MYIVVIYSLTLIRMNSLKNKPLSLIFQNKTTFKTLGKAHKLSLLPRASFDF